MIRTVAVTGASSGIGLATVLHLADIGFDAVGLVRDGRGREALEHAAADRCLDIGVVVADLSDAEARKAALWDVEPWGLVNNAGYRNAGQIRDVSICDARTQPEVMVLAPADLTRQVLPGVVGRGQGRVVNITSSASHTSTPLTGWYQAVRRRETSPEARGG